MRKNRSRRSQSHETGNVNRRRRQQRRLKLEQLEDRRLLATFQVNSFLDTVDANPGDGVAVDSSGNTSLRAAIMEANALDDGGADTINLPAGTYQLTLAGASENGAATGDLDITDDVSIIGAGAATTIIDATGLNDRVLHAIRGTSTDRIATELRDVTITGGLAEGGSSDLFQDYGAGLYMDFYTDVTISNSVFAGNSAPRTGSNTIHGVGGGISNSGNLTILNSRFENNHASNSGGAIYVGGSGATTVIRDSTFTGNVAGGGGAIEGRYTMTIDNSTFVGNRGLVAAGTQGNGGAIKHQSGLLTITNSTISGNESIFGGGLHLVSNLRSYNNTITNNTAKWGGGIRSSGTSTTLENTIVSGNTATVEGPDVNQAVTSLGHNLIGNSAGSSGWVASDLLNVDPQLDVLADNGGPTLTHALQPGSPAIDAANSATAAAADQRGVIRPQGSGPDIGSFEVTASNNAAPVANNDAYVVDEDTTLVVTEQIDAVLRYDFDEANSGASVALDSGSAPAADGTFVGLATRTDNTPGGFSTGALDLTQGTDSSNYVTDNDAAKIDDLTEMTATFWVNLQADPQEGDVLLSDLTSFPADPFTSGWELRITGPTSGTAPTADNFRLEFETAHIGSGLANAQTSFKGPVDADNKWAFVAVTFSANRRFTWYAGNETMQPTSLGATNFAYGLTNLDNPSELRIGSSSEDPNSDRTPPAWFDDVRIYDRVLSHAELEGVRLANLALPQAGVLTNDSDPDGDAITAAVVSGPSNGTLALNVDGSFNYTPDANFNGNDSFTYTANDGARLSNVATVAITVNAVEDPVVANDDSVTTDEDVAVAVAVLANDSDADGDSLSIVSATEPSHGDAVANANGTVTYTPDAGFYGDDSFQYTVTDGNGNNDTATVSVSVTRVNQPPVAVDDSVTIDEDTSATIDVRANDTDPNGDTILLLRATQPRNGQTIVDNNQNVQYIPDADFYGTDSFLYTISDGDGGVSTGTVNVTVRPVNDAPIAADDAFDVYEDSYALVGQGIIFQNDSDIDNTNLTAVIDRPPARGSLQFNADGSFRYTPVPDYNGTDTFTYRASDGFLTSDPATITMTVIPTNDAPDATPDTYFLDEDVPFSLAAPGVLANDEDIDGDAFTARLVSVVRNGDLQLNADGSFTYTPNPDFNGVEIFRYVASDGIKDSAPVEVLLSVRSAEDDPRAADDAYVTDEDTTLNVAAAGVLSNDIEPDGDPMTAVLRTGPSHGSLSLSSDGSFTYTPVNNYNGPDSFTYFANDGKSNIDVATVAITVTAANDAPSASDDSYSMDEDTTLVINATGVLGNDIDVEGDAITAVLASGPSDGSLTLNADGSFTYTPNADFNGTDSFTYKANDGTADGNEATVTINVGQVNDDPVATGESYATDEDNTLTVAAAGVLGNDTDVDGDSLNASLVSTTSDGTLTLNSDGSFTYVPNANFNGSDSFTYQANDGTTSSNVATVNITVNSINDGPNAVNDAATTDEDSAVTITVLGNDSDIEGDGLSVTETTTPANGSVTINADDTVTYTPNADFNGSDSFIYTISDGNGGTAIATVNITVNPVNDVPEAVDAVFALAENAANGTSVGSVQASDVDGDSLAYSLSGQDAAAFAINAQTGEISVFDAALLDFETQSQFDFTAHVSDGNGGSTTANVLIDLLDVGEIAIDVLPNDPNNSINLRSKTIEVAILGSTGFDPTVAVDLSTVQLSAPGTSGGAGVEFHRKRGYKFELRDVNGDGVLDLVMKFKTSETGLSRGDTSIRLTGSLLPEHGGESFDLEQAITITSGGGKKGRRK